VPPSMGMYDYSETEEARDAREEYNKRTSFKNGSSSFSSNNQGSSDGKDLIAFPCPAGVVFVDLADVLDEKSRDSVVGSMVLDSAETSTPLTPPGNSVPTLQTAGESGGGRGSPSLFRGSSFKTRGSPKSRDRSPSAGRFRPSIMPLSRRRRNGSAHSDNSDTTAMSDADDVMKTTGLGLDPWDAKMTIELINFELPPKHGAEDAKLAATNSAVMREEWVTQEQQVRQMWKIAMGNAPGLKAEIAKLHATEQAKSALREFELNARGNGGSSRRPPASPIFLPVPPPTSPSPLPATISAPSSSPPPGPPDKADEEANAPAPAGAHRDGSMSTTRTRSPEPTDGNSLVRRGGSSGVLGWVWSQIAQHPPSDATSQATRPRPGGRGMDGPFTA